MKLDHCSNVTGVDWLDRKVTKKVKVKKLVEGVVEWFRERGVTDIEPYHLMQEDVEFRLPVELRRELALAASQNDV